MARQAPGCQCDPSFTYSQKTGKVLQAAKDPISDGAMPFPKLGRRGDAQSKDEWQQAGH